MRRVNIFDDDDRIVDHKSDGDRQSHQRNIVDAEIEEIHRYQRCGDRERDADNGNDCRPKAAEEQSDDQHDKDELATIMGTERRRWRRE